MNALVATDGNQIGILAAMTGILPARLANAAPETSGFLHFINALITPDSSRGVAGAPVIPTAKPASPATQPAPSQAPPQQSSLVSSSVPTPLPAKSAPHPELAFGAVLTRLAPESAPAPARPKSQPPAHAADVTVAVNPGMPQSVTAPPAAPPRANGAMETPRLTVSEAIRNSELVQPAAAPAPRGSSAQEFALRIAQPNAPVVYLYVGERNGQVQVAVRTPDTGLQTSLRQDLGTLVNSLLRAGYHTETFTPHGTMGQPSSMPEAGAQGDPQDSHAGSPGGSGESADGRRQRQRQRGQNAQDWLEELARERTPDDGT